MDELSYTSGGTTTPWRRIPETGLAPLENSWPKPLPNRVPDPHPVIPLGGKLIHYLPPYHGAKNGLTQELQTGTLWRLTHSIRQCELTNLPFREEDYLQAR